MNVHVIVGWQFGLGVMAGKDEGRYALVLFLPVVIIFVEFERRKRLDFTFENKF